MMTWHHLAQHLSFFRESADPGPKQAASCERAAGSKQMNHSGAGEVDVISGGCQPACERIFTQLLLICLFYNEEKR